MTTLPIRRHRLAAAAVLLLAAGTAACEDILDVEVPTDVDARNLDDPRLAPLLVAGAQADFECAFAQYILIAGSVSDELMNAQTAQAFNPYDQRAVTTDMGSYATGTCESGVGLYTPLAIARFAADNAFRAITDFPDAEVEGRTRLLAAARTYGGFAYTLFGEGFCEAAFDEGPIEQPAAVLARADAAFAEAIQLAQTAGDDALLNAARVGRARVLLRLDRATEAAEVAAQVPTGFVYDATYSGTDPRRENRVFVYNHRERRVSPEPSFWNLAWNGVDDPRVDLVFTDDRGLDQFTPLVLQTKYAAVDAPIPLATWQEARLIQAEAELDAGDVGGAVALINVIHAAAGLPAYAGGPAADVRAHLLQERARELFLESHRLGDLLHYGLPFPTGVHPYTGVPYAETTCLPLPDVERNNNPNA